MVLSKALDKATGRVLENGKSPSRKVNEPDNRAGHFYLAMYWAEALAEQTKDADMQTRFARVAKELKENEEVITAELLAAQGTPAELGGYFFPNDDMTTKVMRPSETLNAIIDGM